MIRLEQTKKEGKDGTAWYNVLLPEDYTIRMFIKDVLKQYKDSWGEIHIEKDGIQIASYSYVYGKLKWKSKLKKIPANKKIISAIANGGYSYLSFYLTVTDKN